jgi:Tol biopolymer transport system component
MSMEPTLPDPQLDLPVDMDGDGFSTFGDRYAFNHWMSLGGMLEDALDVADVTGDVIDLSVFFKVADAGPKGTEFQASSSGEVLGATGCSAPFPFPSTATPSRFTRRIPAGLGDAILNQHCYNPRVSYKRFPDQSLDGSHIVFSSRANLLGLPNWQNKFQVYLFSREAGGNGSLSVVSLDENGNIASEDCLNPDIAGAVTFVVFSTTAPLVAWDNNNGKSDIYLRRVNDSTTKLLSRHRSTCTGPETIGNGDSRLPSISSDGQKVAFTSLASNLDTSGHSPMSGKEGVYLTNTGSCDQTRLVSLAFSQQSPLVPDSDMRTTDPTLVGIDSSVPSSPGKVVSDDGDFVLFEGKPTNWTFSGLSNNTKEQIFIVDLRTSAQTFLISRSDFPGNLPGNQDSRRACMTSDGLVVAFSSKATNLDGDCTDSTTEDIFVRVGSFPMFMIRRRTGSQVICPNGNSLFPVLSDMYATSRANGGPMIDITFASTASNLLPPDDVIPDTNGLSDIFLAQHELGGFLRRVNLTAQGQQATGGHSTNPSLAHGKVLVYESSATNLFGPDSNNKQDIVETILATPIFPDVDKENNGPFLRGDSNNSGVVDTSDAITILDWLFSGAGRPHCLDSADANDSGMINIQMPFMFLIGCMAHVLLHRVPLPRALSRAADMTPRRIP